MSSSKRSTLTTAVRAALVAAAASTAAPALAGDHEIYSNGNLSLSANFWAAIYAVHTTDTAFGAGGGWTGDGSAPKQDVTNFEYVAMPGLTMSWDQGDAGEIYAGFSFAAAGNAGDGDPSGFTVDGESVVRVNEGYVGWRGDVLDFSVGRQAYSIGTQFLIGGQTEFASPRNPFYWLLPFTAYENTAIMRFSPEGPVTGELFWLRFDPRTQGDTQLVGLNLDYALGAEGANGSVGGMLGKIVDADSGFSFAGNPRDDMTVFNARVMGLNFDALPGVALSSEVVLQTGSNGVRGQNAWYVEPSYTFSNVMWEPTVSYRYASFSEAYDPLTYYFDGWNTWFIGEITGEYYLFNNNQEVHMVNLAVTPTPTVTVQFAYQHFLIKNTGVAGVTDDEFANEIGMFVDWAPTDQWYVGGGLAYAMPGDGGNQLLGGTDDDMFLAEISVYYTW